MKGREEESKGGWVCEKGSCPVTHTHAHAHAHSHSVTHWDKWTQSRGSPSESLRVHTGFILHPGAQRTIWKKPNTNCKFNVVPIFIITINCHRRSLTHCESSPTRGTQVVNLFIVRYLMFCLWGMSLKCVRRKCRGSIRPAGSLSRRAEGRPGNTPVTSARCTVHYSSGLKSARCIQKHWTFFI